MYRKKRQLEATAGQRLMPMRNRPTRLNPKDGRPRSLLPRLNRRFVPRRVRADSSCRCRLKKKKKKNESLTHILMCVCIVNAPSALSQDGVLHECSICNLHTHGCNSITGGIIIPTFSFFFMNDLGNSFKLNINRLFQMQF